MLNLNAEWTKNVYDTTNYNIAYDVIEYDYANDMIIRRFEKERMYRDWETRRSMTFLSMSMNLHIIQFQFSNLAIHLILQHIKGN